jgi:hypothetical protein
MNYRDLPEGADEEAVQEAMVKAMKRGYIVHSEKVEGGTAVRLITRSNYIRQQVARFCEVFTNTALAHVETALAGLDVKPGDPVFEQKQLALNVEKISKAAMLAAFAAADAASRDGYESENTFGGLDENENV